MAIIEFRGRYRFLSNFYPSSVILDNVQYPTVEHAYQAAKCKHRSDRIKIRSTATPGEAKRLARRLSIRDDWDDVKLSVMESLVRQKFSTDPLKSQLLQTGQEDLIEGNTWGDIFWGVCRGQGHNHLGRILTMIRTG